MKLIALDVGEKRIGIAKADTGVRIAVPLGMIPVDGQEINSIIRLCDIQGVDNIVIGMPRNLQGQLTQQSEYVQRFTEALNVSLQSVRPKDKIIGLYYQDESLTSVQAKQNLQSKGYDKKAGDIDAEAATIILQDFLENLSSRIPIEQPSVSPTAETTPTAPPPDIASAPSTPTETHIEKKTEIKDEELTVPIGDHPMKKRVIIRTIIIIGVIIVLSGLGAALWYNSSISPVVASDQCVSRLEVVGQTDPCATVQFTIREGSSVSAIADSLKDANLIRDSLAFKIYSKLSGKGGSLKAGTYNLAPSMTVEKIYSKLVEGGNEAEVFRFTVLPGETINDIKKRLISIGYTSEEINKAFYKNYNHPVLADKPADASLEGYLFGETYEFYQTDSVETIIVRMLDELNTVVKENNLREKFNTMGYTLHEGIVMASIVQKEAGIVSEVDQKIVAQVFWSRLENGWKLGSDVTATYAADQIDPDRTFLDNNLAVLDIDSCYNTRKYTGLPCGPISNPGAQALISTANPADTSYLYFLTGDDGLMYYSSTEAEHLLNRDRHCQNLCNVQL